MELFPLPAARLSLLNKELGSGGYQRSHLVQGSRSVKTDRARVGKTCCLSTSAEHGEHASFSESLMVCVGFLSGDRGD